MQNANSIESPETPWGVAIFDSSDIVYSFAQECHGAFLREHSDVTTHILAHMLSSVEGSIISVTSPDVQRNVGVRVVKHANGNYWLALHHYAYATLPYLYAVALLPIYVLQYHGLLASLLRADTIDQHAYSTLRDRARTADDNPRWPENYLLNVKAPTAALDVFEFELEP